MFELEDVEEFINEFKSSHKEEIEELFTTGYCYYFAVIMDARFFQGGFITYIPIYNHFCYSIYGKLFDIKGEITDKEMIKLAEPWEQYKLKDNKETNRLLRDCIIKDTKQYTT